MTIKSSAPISGISLLSVYGRHDRHELLYKLLEDRDATVNISHKAMPCWGDHIRFVESAPYRAWYFIIHAGRVVGAVYLSQQDEIGIFLYKAHQGRGYGRAAIEMLMEHHGPRRYLANINPANDRSRRLFERLGFRLCQHTMELDNVQMEKEGQGRQAPLLTVIEGGHEGLSGSP